MWEQGALLLGYDKKNGGNQAIRENHGTKSRSDMKITFQLKILLLRKETLCPFPVAIVTFYSRYKEQKSQVGILVLVGKT